MLLTFEHAITASNPDAPRRSEPDPPRHLRGEITGFSAASRRRLLRLLSTIRTSTLPPARFVTLTWHRVPGTWHAEALAFRQYIRRRGGAYLWRLEAQKRGAPHLHFIVWCSDWCEAHARETWHRIAGHGSEMHAEYGYDEQQMASYAQCFAYVSKYLAKRDRAFPADLRGHRVWGASRGLPTTATGAAPDLTRAQYYALRRFTRRLMRARSRSKGARLSRRLPSPRALHVFMRAGDPARVAAWLEADLIDPLWTDSHAEALAAAFAPRPPPSTPAPFWSSGQAFMFPPPSALLRG